MRKIEVILAALVLALALATAFGTGSSRAGPSQDAPFLVISRTNEGEGSYLLFALWSDGFYITRNFPFDRTATLVLAKADGEQVDNVWSGIVTSTFMAGELAIGDPPGASQTEIIVRDAKGVVRALRWSENMGQMGEHPDNETLRFVRAWNSGNSSAVRNPSARTATE
jgi:hypothetical protein